jgi:hypothetical protein
MAIKRLLPEGVEIVCACGASTVYAAGAGLTVGVGVIATPVCPACQVRRADIFVHATAPERATAAVQVRVGAGKAVCAWLMAAGQFADGVTAGQIPAELLAGATPWPTTGAVEVPLSPPLAKAHAEWCAAHPQG